MSIVIVTLYVLTWIQINQITWKLLGFKHRKITPWWPSANSNVERMNQSILKSIRTAHAEGKSWKEELYAYPAVYRNTPHPSTNKTPPELLIARQLRTRLSEFKIESETEPTDEKRQSP